MVDRVTVELVGVKDGTANPPRKADGSLVGAKIRSIRGTKQLGADAVGDRILLGTLPKGATVKKILINADTSLATATIAIGTTAAPGKYVAARTFTTPLDAPTIIGPRASAWDDTPLAADEDLYVTIAVAALPGAAIIGFEVEYTTAT